MFLLGPSKWAQGYAPASLPTWLHEHLPKESASDAIPTPLAIRRALAARLGTDRHRIIVMESFPDITGEPKAEKFARLAGEGRETRFVRY